MATVGAALTEEKKGLLDWLDTAAKLLGALAVVAVAFIANTIQGRISAISIQSQREQAESQLRATMFTSLIGPIAGSQKDGASISPDREELLAELLDLNFSENFELKPLMEDASNRRAAAASIKSTIPAEGPDVREHLWSLSRRIAERQKASIAREWETYRSSQSPGSPQGCEVYYVTLDERPRGPDIIKAGRECQVAVAFKETLDLISPDGRYTLRMVVAEANWKDQTVRVSAQPFLSGQGNPKPTDPSYSFSLTWFDLPLTDNTLLPDGNRFAAYLRILYPELKKVVVAVMWFPKGYFTPRERPLNYREVQALMGRKP